MSSVAERRRELEALDANLSDEVLEPVAAMWTPDLIDAAKAVTDVWPDRLAQSSTKLLRALAAYAPQALADTSQRDGALNAVNTAAREHELNLSGVNAALVSAKSYRSERQKAAIDQARDTVDDASVALVSWTANLRLFDTSIQTPPDPPPASFELRELSVSGTDRTSSGLHYQVYQAGQFVRIRAITSPDSAEAHAALAWSGGEPDFSGAPNLRAVSLAKLTEPGKPTLVSAALQGRSLAVKVAVVPDLLRFDVSNAEAAGANAWGIDGDDEQPTVVKVVANPDTQAAYAQLVWTGGEVDPTHPYDRRIVRAADIDPSTGELAIRVKVRLD